MIHDTIFSRLYCLTKVTLNNYLILFNNGIEKLQVEEVESDFLLACLITLKYYI